jgi:uncharacterized protein YkwD
MQVEGKSSSWRRVIAWVVVIASVILFVALVQRPVSQVAQVEPTRRPGQVAGESGEAATPLPAPLNAEETELFADINAKRAEAGCPPLELSSNLAQAARDHGLDMAEHNFFSHTGSDGSKPGARAKRDGYAFLGGFETLSAGQETPAEAVEAWMNSKVHHDILLNCSLDDAGVSFIHDTDGNGFEFYWTVALGSR